MEKLFLLAVALLLSVQAGAKITNNGSANNSVIISGKDAVILNSALSAVSTVTDSAGRKVRVITLGDSDRKLELACIQTQDSEENENNDLLCFIYLDSKF